MISVERILDELYFSIAAFKEEGWSAKSLYNLALDVAEFVESSAEGSLFNGRTKKSIAMEVIEKGFWSLPDSSFSWFYRIIPKYIALKLFKFAASKAIDIAVTELHDKNIFKRF